MVAEPVRETGDLRRDVVELRERTRRHKVEVEMSRIHQEDRSTGDPRGGNDRILLVRNYSTTT